MPFGDWFRLNADALDVEPSESNHSNVIVFYNSSFSYWQFADQRLRVVLQVINFAFLIRKT